LIGARRTKGRVVQVVRSGPLGRAEQRVSLYGLWARVIGSWVAIMFQAGERGGLPASMPAQIRVAEVG